MEISLYTRRDVLDVLIMRDEPFYGLFDLASFLNLVWDLDTIPSTDKRYKTMREDVVKHMYANEDWTPEFLLIDQLGVLQLPDNKFLEFVEATVHPRVRKPKDAIDELVEAINDVLIADGFKLQETRRISNRPVFKAQRIQATSAFEYDVVLSFAGPDRDYVRAVAAIVATSKASIWFDEYDEVDLWGKNLYDHLSEIYGKKARYCVLFASRYYAERVWPNVERQSAQARAIKEKKEYILPVRFDDTDIPGLLDTIVYQDARKKSPEQIANLIVKKIGRAIPQDRLTQVTEKSEPTQEELRFDRLVEDLENSASFADAKSASYELWDREIIMRLTQDQVGRILAAFDQNHQVRGEFRIVKFMTFVWNNTERHIAANKEGWIGVYLLLGNPQTATDEKRLQIQIKRRFPDADNYELEG